MDHPVHTTYRVVEVTAVATVTVMGCDPHLDTISASVMDEVGRELQAVTVSNRPDGWARLAELADTYRVERVGIEGASGYGVPLARILNGLGFTVFEVPTRLTARRRRVDGAGKTDPGDARTIARAVLTGDGYRWADTPHLEIIRVLTVRREQLVTQQTADINQLRALMADLDPERSTGTPRLRTSRAIQRFITITIDNPTRYQQTLLDLIEAIGQACLDRATRIRELESRMRKDLPPAGHALIDRFYGCDVVTACQILAEIAGADSFATDAKFAAWNGTAPLDASSGRQHHHRLNRGGNRQVNRAIHTIVLTQIRNHGQAADYLHARNPDNNKKHRAIAIRAAKRHVARQVWKTLRDHEST
jgi:transposase